MGFVLCYVVGFIYGNLGRGLATLAIIIIGVGATLGKVSWGLAITVGIGIAIVFNATVIMNAIVSNSSGFPGAAAQRGASKTSFFAGFLLTACRSRNLSQFIPAQPAKLSQLSVVAQTA